MKGLTPLLVLLIMFGTSAFSTPEAVDSVSDDYWVVFCDGDFNCGYLNSDGDTMIPAGKYLICRTDTFRAYAKVLQPKGDWIGIDKSEKILYKIHLFDNGPDDASEGLFRIWKNGKMGYADERTGKVMLYPQYSAGFQFEKGIAKVSTNPCTEEADYTGEHHSWVCDEWFYIDHTGKKVDPPTNNE